MNRWNIAGWLEKEVIERDRRCVYRRIPLGSGTGKGSFASWEPIANDARIIARENIVLCRRSCNSSNGAKLLAVWLESAYRERHGITGESVADIVKRALMKPPSSFSN